MAQFFCVEIFYGQYVKSWKKNISILYEKKLMCDYLFYNKKMVTQH